MNINSTLDQPYQLAAMVYTGVIAGLVYAAIYLIKSGSKSRALRIICDIAFILFALVYCLISIYDANGYALRPYHFLGLIAGFIAAYLAIVPAYLAIERKFINMIIVIRRKRKYNSKVTPQRKAKHR